MPVEPHGGNVPDLGASLDRATIPRGKGQPARLALELREGSGAEDLSILVAGSFPEDSVEVEKLSDLDHEVLIVTFPALRFGADSSAAFSLANAVARLPIVRAAEPDLFTDFYPEPDGAERLGREGLDNLPIGCWTGEDRDLSDPHWALKAMRIPEAWAFSQSAGRPSRGRDIVVAQPDTGVVRHSELDPTRRVAAIDLIQGDADPEDPLDYSGQIGHGTATGSVVVSAEGGGMAGSAPEAVHMPIRCIRTVIRVSQVSVARAIDHAVTNGAHVITMSLGGLPSIALRRAVRRAVGSDVIVLAAAGNCVRTVVWPARYDDCLAVAGVNRHDRHWKGSCRGSAVDFSAPAENVYRARPDGTDPRAESRTVGQGEGTSFAVALTAGAAALWLAHHGRANLIIEARNRGETLQDMFRRLVVATARRPAGWDATDFGAGIVNAEALVRASLDLGRDRESLAFFAPDATRSVKSLIAERLGAAAVDRELDYRQHGAELAYLLLSSAREVERDEDGLEAAAAPLPPASSDLAAAVSNAALRAALVDISMDDAQ